MSTDSRNAADRHRAACLGFTECIAQVSSGWDQPSPCSEWDARGVLEHVIGFHTVLLLNPLEIEVHRPKEGPVERWDVTHKAILSALTGMDQWKDDTKRVLPMLTTDVLIHTWDLGRSTGVPVTLDTELCARALAGVAAHEESLRSSGMFGPAFTVPPDASVEDRLLGIFGRDPAWRGPTEG